MLTPLTKAIRVPDSLLPPLDKGRVRVGLILGGFRLKVLQMFELKLTPMIHEQSPKDSG